MSIFILLLCSCINIGNFWTGFWSYFQNAIMYCLGLFGEESKICWVCFVRPSCLFFLLRTGNNEPRLWFEPWPHIQNLKPTDDTQLISHSASYSNPTYKKSNKHTHKTSMYTMQRGYLHRCPALFPFTQNTFPKLTLKMQVLALEICQYGYIL